MHIAVSAGACIDQEIASQRAAGGQMAEEPRKGAECAVGIIAPTGARGGSPDVAMIPPPRRDVSRQRTFELRGKITEADTVPLRIVRIDDIRPTVVDQDAGLQGTDPRINLLGVHIRDAAPVHPV